MQDIFVGICYSLTKSKNSIFPNNDEINKEDCLAVDTNKINHVNLNFQDDVVNSAENFELNFTEFAPRAFKLLRSLENVEEDELIK